MTIYNIHTLHVCTYISQFFFLRNAFVYTLFIYRSICTTHAHTVTKITKKPRGSNGSMVYSLGMGGGTAKKTRMAIKSLRKTAAENSARIKGKRVGKQIAGRQTRMKKPAGSRDPPLTHIPNATLNPHPRYRLPTTTTKITIAIKITNTNTSTRRHCER